MSPWISFLQSQQLLSIATSDASGAWIANVYFVADLYGNIFYVSPMDTRHSRMILENPAVAFASAWFDPENRANRKAVQGLGGCELVDDESVIRKAVGLHNVAFPEFSGRISPDWIKSNEFGSRVWKITPNFVKYWDDDLYGEEESRGFAVSRVMED